MSNCGTFCRGDYINSQNKTFLFEYLSNFVYLSWKLDNPYYHSVCMSPLHSVIFEYINLKKYSISNCAFTGPSWTDLH